MPRVAATLGVFATLAFCVGFNVVQYPTVWDMVALPNQSSQADETTAPSTSAQPPAPVRPAAIPLPDETAKAKADLASKPAPKVPAMAPSMPPVAKPVCDSASGTCRVPGGPIPDPHATSANSGNDLPSPIGWPRQSPPATKTAGNVKSGPAAHGSPKKSAVASSQGAAAKAAAPPAKVPERAAASGNKDLVPVVRTPKVPAAKQPRSLAPSDAPKNSGEDREPKLVRRLPPVDDTTPVALFGDAADGPIPVYPSTGVR